jgi:putative nucleotidyltransferase with HDIG domain
MLHRLRQFATAGRPPTAADYALGRAWLKDPLFQLFTGQHPRDIAHTAATARWLIERGHDDPALIQAALLHDIGKGEQRRLDRAAAVLATATRSERILGAADSRLATRRAIERTRIHADAGAHQLIARGADDRVVELTRAHHDPPGTDTVLALLQEADNAT